MIINEASRVRIVTKVTVIAILGFLTFETVRSVHCVLDGRVCVRACVCVCVRVKHCVCVKRAHRAIHESKP